MLHRPGKSAALPLLALALGVSAAPEVSACTPPEPGWILYAGYTRVPANSALAMSLECSEACGTGPILSDIKLYASGTVTVVAGSVVLSGGEGPIRWAVFRPDSALEVGRRYELRLGDAPALDPFERIEAIEAHTPSASTWTPSHQVLVRDRQVGPWVCCPVGPRDSCEDLPCHATQVLAERVVRVDWTDPLGPESLWFLHRVLQPGGAADPPWSWANSSIELAVEQGDTQEACSTLELRSLIDDSIHRFDERCVALPDDLGLRRTEPAALMEFLAECHAPPRNYEAEWCLARTAYCSTNECEWSAGAGGAGALAERCPVVGNGGTGGGPAVGGAGGEAGGGGESGSGGGASGVGGEESGNGGSQASAGGVVGATSGGSPGGSGESTGTAKGTGVADGAGCSLSGPSRRSDLGLLVLSALFTVRSLRRSRSAR